MPRIRLTRLAAALAVLLAGCSTLELRVETSTPPAEATATAPAVTEPPSEPTSAPTAEPTSQPPVLPAPVYFISAADGQLWRLAPDGRTLTQLTSEPAPVTEFDVSPAGGALVYIAGNELVRAAADGGGRVVLLRGPALTGAEDDLVARTLRDARWSPDGSQIAFGLNGVNLIPAEGGLPRRVIQSDPVPATRQLARFYRPQAWSPDGARLAVAVNFWQEGLIYAIYSFADDALLDVESACCDPIWSRDGQSLFLYGSSPEGYDPPGLWRVDVATGQAVTLLEGRRDGDLVVHLAANPYEAADGTLYFLFTAQSPNADGVYLWPPYFQLAGLPADAEPGAAPAIIRAEARRAFEADWAGDGRGLVIREVDPGSQPPSGALVWLPADPALPAVPLPADGAGARMP